MNLFTKFLAIYNKTGWRGCYRLTSFFSNRFKSLQNCTIEANGGIIFVDLRIPSSRGILVKPNSTNGEGLVMRNLIKENQIVYDIGAHFGYFTPLLSKLVGKAGKVYAFEPNPELLPSLTQTIETLPNTKLFPIALSDEQGKTNLFVPEDTSMTSLTDWTHGNAGKVHQVECELNTLDNLITTHNFGIPSFIKCDVEGAELSVFKGATKLLNRTDAPIILFEINSPAIESFGRKTEDYFDFLKSLEHPNYSFFEVTKNGLNKLTTMKINYANILAVPKTKISLCQDILN